MEVNIASSLIFLIKIPVFIFISAFVSMFVLWPINDKNTTKTQFIIFALIVGVIGDAMFFGLIKYT